MSHFTHMKTRFQNLFYLEKALNKLNIVHNKPVITSDSSNANLIIPQSNGYDIEFSEPLLLSLPKSSYFFIHR